MATLVKQPPTAAELYAARNACKKLIEKARAFIILDEPFFSTIMLKHPFVEDVSVKTLGVNARGVVYYNPMFVATLTVDNVVWAICHELMHYASGHALRRQHRDQKKWNIAGDMWINDTLNTAGVGQKIEGCVDVPGSKDRTVEDIYAGFPPDDSDDGDGGQGQGRGQGQGDEDENPDPIKNDVSDEGLSDSEVSEIDAERKCEVAEAAQVAKMKGNLAGVLQKFVADTVQSVVPWYDILERFMTERVKTEQSWARPNRRYAPEFYLPTVDGVGAMGEMVIQVDISGSVSPKEIEHYNGHMKRIIEQCHPEKVHVIYTDTEVQRHDEFDKPDEVEIKFYSGGGTHMPAGFQYIQDKGIEPEVVITLTDGYTDWDEAPPFPTVHCISTPGLEAPYGMSVHFDTNAE